MASIELTVPEEQELLALISEASHPHLIRARESYAEHGRVIDGIGQDAVATLLAIIFFSVDNLQKACDEEHLTDADLIRLRAARSSVTLIPDGRSSALVPLDADPAEYERYAIQRSEHPMTRTQGGIITTPLRDALAFADFLDPEASYPVGKIATLALLRLRISSLSRRL